MSNKSMHRVINIDFSGFCHGHCLGCLLTKSEITNPNALLSWENFEKGLAKLSLLFPQNNVEQTVIGVGRGNTLLLSNQDRDLAFKMVKALISNLKLDKKNTVIEFSTSLIGKIETQIEVAEKMLLSPLNVRFNVVVNSAVISDSFWLNADKFFSHLSSFRGGGDGSGDILVLNVEPENLPDLKIWWPRLKKYRFPVNVVATPFVQDIPDVDALNNLDIWTKELWQLAIQEGIDLNWMNLAAETKNSQQVEDILFGHEETMKNFCFMSSDGNIHQGFFSHLGDVDLYRWSRKAKIILPDSARSLYKKFSTLKPCLSCPVQNRCLALGGHVTALMNYHRALPSTRPVCWNGLLSSLLAEAENG